jgi:hypothetical protein
LAYGKTIDFEPSGVRRSADNELSDESLVREGREDWKYIEKEWDPALKRYETGFDKITKAHDDLVRERADLQRMCPGVAPPEIPDVPEKHAFKAPESPLGE